LLGFAREWSWHEHNTAVGAKHSDVAALQRTHHVEDQPRSKIFPHGITGRVFVGSESNFAGSGPAAGFGLSVSNCTIFRTSTTILHLSQSTVWLDILTS
jgi:hypothetical protein